MADLEGCDPNPAAPINQVTTKGLPDPGAVLHLAYVQARSKRVYFDDMLKHNITNHASDADLLAVDDIRTRILAGRALDRYYRASTRADILLSRHGVMHLHLSSPRSKALLYLMQFTDCVLFLCIESHVHVDETPVGRSLKYRIMLDRFRNKLGLLP